MDDRREAFLAEANAAAGGIQALDLIGRWIVNRSNTIDRDVEADSITMETAALLKKQNNALAAEVAKIARGLQDRKLKAEGGAGAMAGMITSLQKREAAGPAVAEPPAAQAATPGRPGGTTAGSGRPKLAAVPQHPGRGIKAQRQAEAAKKREEVKGREAARRAAIEDSAKPDATPVPAPKRTAKKRTSRKRET